MSVKSSRDKYHVGLKGHEAGKDFFPIGQENGNGDEGGGETGRDEM